LSLYHPNFVKEEVEKMKRKVFAAILVITFIIAWSHIVAAEQQSITIPKETKVGKIGAGHYKFKLPDGSMVEVRNFNAKAGIVGDCGVYNPKGKLIFSGKQVSIKGAQTMISPSPPAKQIKDVYLPATIILRPPKK
jgi:hypothetical protein